jgi:2-octaprenyl-6-methoxyphenol hydroxylase
LIGNIAHNIHPIAWQGLNLSIKDVALLVKQINKYKSLGYKLNNQMMLEEFEMERKLDSAAYSFGTFSLNGILSSRNCTLNNLIKLTIYLTDLDNFDKLNQVFLDFFSDCE